MLNHIFYEILPVRIECLDKNRHPSLQGIYTLFNRPRLNVNKDDGPTNGSNLTPFVVIDLTRIIVAADLRDAASNRDAGLNKQINLSELMM